MQLHPGTQDDEPAPAASTSKPLGTTTLSTVSTTQVSASENCSMGSADCLCTSDTASGMPSENVSMGSDILLTSEIVFRTSSCTVSNCWPPHHTGPFYLKMTNACHQLCCPKPVSLSSAFISCSFPGIFCDSTSFSRARGKHVMPCLTFVQRN
jgi:hypothetical protein